MKKILIVTDNVRDQINGVVTTFKNLEKHAYSAGYSIVYLDPREFPHRDCPGYPEVKLAWPRGIGQKIDTIDPDYIHIATEGPLGLAARLYLDHKKYRYNTSYHTDFPQLLKKIYGIPKWITYLFLRWFHKHSGRVLTTTPAMVKDLELNGFKKVLSWTRGVDRDSLIPNKVRHYNRKPVVLNVGRISKEKGLDDIVPLQYEFEIIFVGDGPYREELQKKIPNALFVGYKQGAELANYYNQADVFVFPSRSDTFGLVMIEAMSLGTPVAAYPVRGPLEVIDQGITGIVNNDLYTAVNQAMSLDRDQVKEHSQKWSWDKCWQIFERNLIQKT